MLPDSRSEIDVIVPLRNEAERIPGFFAMLQAQTLKPTRVIIADGMSTDGSRAALLAMQKAMPHLIVVDNPRQIVPAALNVCLRHVRSPVVARMDTHAEYDPGYLEAVARVLFERPEVTGVGGAMETAGRGVWGIAIASTLRRPFGLGGARHRIGGRSGAIQHVFSGCYRTQALIEVDGWDERFHANEDFEADTRLRGSGGTLWLSAEARSTWYVRESPRALAIQMWRYGYYKALTLRLHPASLQPRQLLPPTLVLGLLGGVVVSPRRTGILGAAYAIAVGTLGARAAWVDGASPLRGAFIPPVVHISWGAGLVFGVLRFAGATRDTSRDAPRSKPGGR